MAWSLSLLAAVWMAGSMIHYTILPKCLTRSSFSVLLFSLLQTIVTAATSYYAQSSKSLSKLRPLLQQPNVAIAALSFAIATALTNTGVVFGSVSGTRLIKSLEPVLVACMQCIVHRQASAKASYEPAWLFLLVASIFMTLGSSPVYITYYSALAALISTLGVVARNVCIKKELDTGVVCRSPCEIQTAVNVGACGLFLCLLCLRILLGDGVGGDIAALLGRLPLLVLGCIAFAAFQIAAVLVLGRVSATRQSAIKSVHNSVVTLWTMLIHRSQAGLTLEDLAPTAVWCATVMAIASDARISPAPRHEPESDVLDAQKPSMLSTTNRPKLLWQITAGVCWTALLAQSARHMTHCKLKV